MAGRRAVLERLRAWSPPPALGPAPDLVSDPMAILLLGVTTDRLDAWLGGEGAATALTGLPGAPGVAEGPVRVVLAAEDLGQLREGEVLVAPAAAPGWGAAFGRADAAVTDVGGLMSEAATLAREHGLPAVVATGFATASLRTGQKVRVDGHGGVVTLLDA